MPTLNEIMNGDLVIVYQVEELALVESFWGNFRGIEGGNYSFHINKTKELLPVFSVNDQIRDGQDIVISPHKITRVMASEGPRYWTIWKMDKKLAPSIQGFYEGLSAVCDSNCSGWARADIEVFLKEGRTFYGKISHEILDEGVLNAKSSGSDKFTLDTLGSSTIMPISNIDKILAYSWPDGSMKPRKEEIAYQAKG